MTPATVIVGLLLIIGAAAMATPLMLLPGSPTGYAPLLGFGVAAAMAAVALRHRAGGRREEAVGWASAAFNLAGLMTAIRLTMWSLRASWS